MNYKAERKRKMSDPRDQEFFSRTFLAHDLKGVKRRYITGECTVCKESLTCTWSNFATKKSAARAYTFIHKHCSDREWVKELKVRKTDHGDAALAHFVWKQYRRGAHKREFEFLLTEEQVGTLIKTNCVYCHASPRSHYYYTHLVCNGIDRRNNSIGYVYENCVTCCTECNFYKRDADYDKWSSFLERVKLGRRD